MVLFRDEELKLIAAERAAEPRWKKRLRLSVKIVCWIVGLFGFSLVVMSTLSGRSDPLKRGIEQYLVQVTGMRAKVGNLRYMSFFPVVSVDFEDLAFYPMPPAGKGAPDIEPVQGEALATVGHVRIAMGFWDLLFANRKLKFLDIDQADITPGLIDRRAVKIDFLRLDPKGWQDKPALLLQGVYGDEALNGTLQMQVKGRAFKVPKSAHFDLSAGTLQWHGSIGHDNDKGLVLTLDPAAAGVAGQLSLLSRRAGHYVMGADLHAGKSVLKAAFESAPENPGGARSVKGTIAVPALDIADAPALGGFLAAMTTRWPGPPSWQADVTIGRLTDGTRILGHGKARLERGKDVLTISGLQGALHIDDAAAKTFVLQAPGLDIAMPVTALPGCIALQYSVKSAAKPAITCPGAAGKAGAVLILPPKKAD